MSARPTTALCCLVLATLAAAAACTEPRPPTVATAVDLAREGRAAALDQAWRAVEAAAPYTLAARYNPAACPCPEFEVYYLGSWHRVVLTGSTPAIEQLRAALGAAPVASTTATVVGSPTGAAQRTTEQGQLFPVFELESVP